TWVAWCDGTTPNGRGTAHVTVRASLPTGWSSADRPSRRSNRCDGARPSIFRDARPQVSGRSRQQRRFAFRRRQSAASAVSYASDGFRADTARKAVLFEAFRVVAGDRLSFTHAMIFDR